MKILRRLFRLHKEEKLKQKRLKNHKTYKHFVSGNYVGFVRESSN